MNRYYIRYEFENIDEPEFCHCNFGAEIDSAIVDAESQEQAEQFLFEYDLSHFSLKQLETVEIKSVKFMGEVPDEKQLRFAV